MIYVLLVFAHVGMMGKGNSNALVTQEFNSKEKCEAAISAYAKLAGGSTKEVNAVCVEK